MLKNRQNQDNRFTPGRVIAAIMTLAIVVYWFAFFGQPSLLGFNDDAGKPLPRWIDLSMLLLVDELFAGMSGHGRLETGIMDRIPIAFAGTLYIALGCLVGYPMLLLTQLTRHLSRLEIYALSALSGLALLSTVTLLVGLMHGLHTRWPLVATIAILVSISLWYQRRWGAWEKLAADKDDNCTQRLPVEQASTASNAADSEVVRPFAEPSQALVASTLGSQWLQRFLPVAVCGMGLLYVLSSLITPYEFDVVEYHLQAPKEFAAAGKIDFVPHNIYANMPLGAEMHCLAMMALIGQQTPDAWWWGGLIGKFVIGSFSLIAAALLGGFFHRQWGGFGGWSSAGLLLAVPGNVFVTNAGLIDSVVGTYLLAMLVIWSTRWPRERLIFCFGLASLLAGAAGACKYPGLVFAIVPLMIASSCWIWQMRLGLRLQLQMAGAGLVAMCVTIFPWLIKNAIYAGNPVYPLAANLFGGRGLDAQRIAQWELAHAVPRVGDSTYGAAALLKGGRQVLLESPFLSPSLVAPAICGVFACLWFYFSNSIQMNNRSPRPAGEERGKGIAASMFPAWLGSWIGLAVWILLVWFFATHRIDRFWLPVVPICAGMATLGIVFIARWLSISLAACVVLVSLGYGAFVTASGALGDNRFFVSLKALREDAGDDEIPGRMSPIALWVNRNLTAPTDSLWLVGEARVFDFVPSITYATCFNDNPAELLLRDKTAQEQRENLWQAKVTHLLINWSEIDRYRSPGNYGFSEWPNRGDVERWLADGIVERVQWPVEETKAELLKVVREPTGVGTGAADEADTSPSPVSGVSQFLPEGLGRGRVISKVGP